MRGFVPVPPTDKERHDAFLKSDSGKPRMSLVPQSALLAVARVLTVGAKKYSDDNWRKAKAEERVRFVDAALRHINAHQRGEVADTETGENHLAHAICSLMFLLELEEEDAQCT